MKGRVLLKTILSVVLLLVAAAPGLASGSDTAERAEAAGAPARPASSGWVIETVDATNDVGSHVSMASYDNGQAHITGGDWGILLTSNDGLKWIIRVRLILDKALWCLAISGCTAIKDVFLEFTSIEQMRLVDQVQLSA